MNMDTLCPAFISKDHCDIFKTLMKKENNCMADMERVTLFYLLSGNHDLFNKHMRIYDFQKHGILNCLSMRDVDFCSGSQSLIRLGYNLYNGYTDDETSPFHLLSCLDEANRKLAINAIKIRFRIE